MKHNTNQSEPGQAPGPIRWKIGLSISISIAYSVSKQQSLREVDEYRVVRAPLVSARTRQSRQRRRESPRQHRRLGDSGDTGGVAAPASTSMPCTIWIKSSQKICTKARLKNIIPFPSKRATFLLTLALPGKNEHLLSFNR